MAVFPAASGNFLPDSWRNLMMDPVSVLSLHVLCVCVCARVFVLNWLLQC